MTQLKTLFILLRNQKETVLSVNGVSNYQYFRKFLLENDFLASYSGKPPYFPATCRKYSKFNYCNTTTSGISRISGNTDIGIPLIHNYITSMNEFGHIFIMYACDINTLNLFKKMNTYFLNVS